ncbi:class I SAM-dependent methyltransferase [Streptomyces sp. NPDC086787]|uniref:class I SAM-dependent methyltransferase n=1 Tax=Streptomyces sp. NPDC086787 TaxID=3365759 RepID=UPI003802C60D
MTTTVRPDHAADAYDATASFYDVLTQHDDYDAFAAVLDRLIQDAGPRGRRLLDAGCGNGRSSVLFADRGYDVTGVDISPAMIDMARSRHAATGIEFAVHDVRRPLAHEPYDVVLCMSDIFNYLIEPAQVSEAFHSIAASLTTGGVLIFDANTAYGYDLMRAPHVMRGEDTFVVTRGNSEEEGGVRRFRIVLDAFQPAAGQPGLWTRKTVEHFQAHHSPREFTDLLTAAGLRLVGHHGLHISGTLADGIDETTHTKGLYVAVKTDA